MENSLQRCVLTPDWCGHKTAQLSFFAIFVLFAVNQLLHLGLLPHSSRRAMRQGARGVFAVRLRREATPGQVGRSPAENGWQDCSDGKASRVVAILLVCDSLDNAASGAISPPVCKPRTRHTPERRPTTFPPKHMSLSLETVEPFQFSSAEPVD